MPDDTLPPRQIVAEYFARMTDQQQGIMQRFRSLLHDMQARHALELQDLNASYHREMEAFQRSANEGLSALAQDAAVAVEVLRYQKEVLDKVGAAIRSSPEDADR